MTSLVLSRFRPDDTRGGAALRNRQNMLALARLGAVDVASIGVHGMADAADGIRMWAPFEIPGTSSRIRGRWLWHRRSFPSACDVYAPAAARWLRASVSRWSYDLVVIEGLTLVGYLPELLRLGCRVVFDAHNVETALCEEELRGAEGFPRRLKNTLIRRRIAALERYAVSRADLVWACSDRDATELARGFRATAPIAVVPNGVDVAAYRRKVGTLAGTRSVDWSNLPVTMVYPGLFSYGPNEQAALKLVDRVLPAVRRHGVPARVVLAGRDPTPAMRERAGHDAMVTVTGPLKSMVPILHQPSVVTLPILVGSGTRLKILESFAAGTPVVTTAKGAEGLDVRNEEHLLIRETPEAMASAVVDLWRNPERRRGMCERAHALVRDRYSWSAAAMAIAVSLSHVAGLRVSRPPTELLPVGP